MDTPAKRIQWALEQRAIGVRELARRLGVSPDYRLSGGGRAGGRRLLARILMKLLRFLR